VRKLVYFLLFANLAYFVWHQYSPIEKPRDMKPVPLAPGIEPLVLLKERPSAEPPVVVAAEQADEEPPPVAAVEAETEIEAEAEAIPVVEYSAPAIPQPERVCQTIGPLLDKNDAASISAQLYQQGYQPAVRGGEVREPSGYWVYMPAMPAGEARAIVNDLDANGMKDYFIGKRNHISLGIFSSKRKARARLKRIKTLGYDAQLDQRYRTRTVFWLDIEEKEQPLLGSEFWERIQAEHADIRVQRVSCE